MLTLGTFFAPFTPRSHRLVRPGSYLTLRASPTIVPHIRLPPTVSLTVLPTLTIHARLRP
jgi:hypothetical protein